MDYPRTRAIAALTAAYNVFAIQRPDALVEGLGGQVTEASSKLLGRTWAGRDLPLAALVLAGPSHLRPAAVALRIVGDLTDATVLGIHTDGTPRRKALGVTLGWAGITAAAYVLDRRSVGPTHQ